MLAVYLFYALGVYLFEGFSVRERTIILPTPDEPGNVSPQVSITLAIFRPEGM